MKGSMLPVLRSDELTSGVSPTQPEIRRVSVGESEVLLARIDGRGVVAFAPVCPHQDTSLEDATVWDGSLRCPRHLYLYDPDTGENILPARDALPGTLWKLRPGYLPVYRVEEREGWIWVADAPEPPPASYDPELERRPTGPPDPVPEAPATSIPTGPLVHPPEELSVTAGAEFEVTLTTTIRPGHLWRADVTDELVVVSQGIDPASASAFRVRLRAGVPGEVTMRWIYARPWDVDPAEIRIFVVRIASPSP